MKAKRLEMLLAREGRLGEAEMVQRFQKLRDIQMLPNSRGKNAEDLSSAQVVSGILATISDTPAYAAITSKILQGLLPVGGSAASFCQAGTFGQALECILTDAKALASIREVRVSNSEIYTNSTGRASITYAVEDKEITAYYIRREGVSLLQPGAEKTYDPRSLISNSIIERVFYDGFFTQIARAHEYDKQEADRWAVIQTAMLQFEEP